MMEKDSYISKPQTVSVAIGTSMYGRFKDLPNTPSHVLAEFVDNALQSYRDNKSILESMEPDYKLRVSIDFAMDADGKIISVDVNDNAGGISKDKFNTAFMPAKKPDNDLGLNEFGMGLKTAACWLGEDWLVKTSAINEPESKTINFCLNDICAEDLRELPVKYKAENSQEHYTHIHIESPTSNMPSKKSIGKICNELSSIYRVSLRNKEFELYVQDKSITFEDYPVLNEPYVHDSEGSPIFWKKEVRVQIGPYKGKGFVGILKDIKQGRNGFVILRRGRAVVGNEDNHRYYPKFMGSQGTFKYKRLFGEIEVEGFNVSFNKNDIPDRENLEALFDMIKEQIYLPDFNMLKQAEDYRVSTTKKDVLKIIRKHKNTPKDKKTPVSISSTTQPATSDASNMVSIVPADDRDNSYEDTFCVDGKEYTLKIDFCEGGTELFYNDITDSDNNILTCKVNMNHPFFENIDQKKSPSSIVLIKSMAIAKFAALKKDDDSITGFMRLFNDYIMKVKS